MAEAAPSSSPPEPLPYLKGSFRISKVSYDVSLSETKLTWKIKGGDENKAVKVPVEEIIYADRKESPAGVVCGVDVTYIKHKKNNVKRHQVVHFLGSAQEAEEWSRAIQEAISKVEGRPRKLLVLVNPVSGSSNGRQIYRKHVAKIFQIAHIETDVIVTERAHHTEEIVSNYDLKSIDGLVLVGGDGLLHEATSGLQLRILKEAGLDKNDSSINLQQLPLPIGIIPAGTGNGLANWSNGNYDIETAALNIVTGRKDRYNLIGAYCCGELVGYSCLHVGIGLWGDMIYSAETKRYLGKLRYLVCLVESLFINAQRPMNLVLDYLTAGTKPADQNKETLSDTHENTRRNISSCPRDVKEMAYKGLVRPILEYASPFWDLSGKTLQDKLEKVQNRTARGTAEDSTSETQWQGCEGVFSGVVLFSGDMLSLLENDTVTPTDYGTFLVNKPCGRLAILGMLKKIVTRDISGLNNDVLRCVQAKEFKLRLVSPSDPESTLGRKERIANIDGEIFYLKQPEITVRLHPKTVQLFSKGTNSAQKKEHPPDEKP